MGTARDARGRLAARHRILPHAHLNATRSFERNHTWKNISDSKFPMMRQVAFSLQRKKRSNNALRFEKIN
jgi:hypothetical protein